MTRLIEIAAVGSRGELGLNGDMPWGRSLKQDLKFFKEQTKGHPVLMGRKTWQSLPGALPGRANIVITRGVIDNPKALTFSTLEEGLAALKQIEEESGNDKAFIIGGGSVYAAMIDKCDELLLTEIESTFDADTWFPAFNRDDFERKVLDTIEENGFTYSHVRYVRKPR